MGCNCGKPKKLNNLNSQSHLLIAKDVYDRIISQKTIEEIDDSEWVEIYQAYKTVYPNSTSYPDKQRTIEMISNSLMFLKVKYK